MHFLRFFVNVVEDANVADAQLPDWGPMFKAGRQTEKTFSVPRRHGRLMA